MARVLGRKQSVMEQCVLGRSDELELQTEKEGNASRICCGWSCVRIALKNSRGILTTSGSTVTLTKAKKIDLVGIFVVSCFVSLYLKCEKQTLASQLGCASLSQEASMGRRRHGTLSCINIDSHAQTKQERSQEEFPPQRWCCFPLLVDLFPFCSTPRHDSGDLWPDRESRRPKKEKTHKMLSGATGPVRQREGECEGKRRA